MESVFRIGVDSVKVSFPSMQRGAQLSVREIEEIESAVAQMEFWNALSSIPCPKERPALEAKDEVKIGKNTQPAVQEEGGIIENEPFAAFDCKREHGTPRVVSIENRVIKPVEKRDRDRDVGGLLPRGDLGASGKYQDSEIKRKDDKYSRFEHVHLQGMDPYLNLRRPFAIFMDTAAQAQDTSPRRVSVRQPLQQVKANGLGRRRDTSKPKQRITPEKENAPPSRFKVRRKPAPHLSELPSTPLRELRTGQQSLKSQFKKHVIESFPKPKGSGHGTTGPGEVQEAPKEVRIRNFRLKTLLGAGAQGRVYLAQGSLEWDGRRVFAIKVMIKNRYVHYDTIVREQKLLKRLRGHKFILQLEGSFHDRRNFYLVTQYHPGRDLDDLLRNQGCFDTSATRFYAAELSSALVFLHKNHILHRDVKLSNILIKEDGHLCLSDFGLGADFTDQVVDEDEDSFMADAEPVARGFAGTTVYMAPEVLNNEYYSYKIDWWSSGVTLYSLLEGKFPWPCAERQWLAEHAGIESPRFGVATDAHAKSFVRALLQRDPDQRIGDIDVFSHPFFNGIKIQDIDQGKLKPPYVPDPVDHDNLPNALTRRDYIDIGLSYPPGEAPMSSYFFYGSTLPACKPCMAPEGVITQPEELSPPLNCSRSLFQLLQESEADSEDATLRNSEPISGSPSPFRASYALTIHNPSGTTLVEEQKTDNLPNEPISLDGAQQSSLVVTNDPVIRSSAQQNFGDDTGRRADVPRSAVCVLTGTTRKDSRFRWSMLAVEEGQFDDAVGPQNASAIVERGDSVGLGQVPIIGLNPILDLDPEIVGPIVGLDNKQRVTVHQAPSIPEVSLLVTPPREDREATVVVADNEINSMLLSPEAGGDNSVFETVTPLSFGTGANDETAVTTLELGSPGSNASSGLGAGSASPGLGSGLYSDLASLAGFDASMNKPLPPVPGCSFQLLSDVNSSDGYCNRLKNQVARWFKNVSEALVKDVKKAGGNLQKRVMEA